MITKILACGIVIGLILGIPVGGMIERQTVTVPLTDKAADLCVQRCAEYILKISK